MQLLIQGSKILASGEITSDGNGGYVVGGVGFPAVLGAMDVIAPTDMPADYADGLYAYENGAFVLLPPLPDPAAEAAKAEAAEAQADIFNSRRDDKIAAGFSYDFTGHDLVDGTPAGKLTLQMGADDQINWLGRVMQAQLAIAAGQGGVMMKLRTLENKEVALLPVDVINVLNEAGNWKDDIIFLCSAAKDKMTAYVTDPSKTLVDVLGVTFDP